MLTVQEINSAIINGSFSSEQLSSVIDAVKYRRSLLTRSVIHQLSKGDIVSFVNKHGNKVVGTVSSIKMKYVHVDVGMVTWRVPASKLVRAELSPV